MKKQFRLTTIILLGTLIFNGCKKNDKTPEPTPSPLPVISTTNISSITVNTALSGGNVTSEGASAITAVGVCWDTNPSPTTLKPHTNNGAGTGSYTSAISSLTPGTTYYVRAYATNGNGTAYGNEISFTTASLVNLSSVTIGTQIWSSTNLNVRTYRNGDPIPNVTDSIQWSNLTTGAWCWYNNDSATYAATYGRLYNWYAVNDPRGLAPQGWHIPTDAEYTLLTSFLGGESVAGGKMKSTGALYWQVPNTGASNESGFSGLPGGFRYHNGTFNNVGMAGLWWSSSAYGTYDAWFYGLGYNVNDVTRSSSLKEFAMSVRCIRD